MSEGKKVAEGKNKRTVINAIRAKSGYRIFAVMKHDRIYGENYVDTPVIHWNE